MQTDGLGHLSNYSSQLQNQFNAAQPFTHLTLNYAFLTRFNTNSELRVLFRCPHSVLLSRFHVGILGKVLQTSRLSVHSRQLILSSDQMLSSAICCNYSKTPVFRLKNRVS